MSNLAIITARSGSKGIRDKNIRLLNGKPLMAYTIESAIKSHWIDEVMVSTDSEKYAAAARKYGADVPFLRSKAASTDTASSKDVILEVLDEYEKMGKTFDQFVLLRPTSPLRTERNIDQAFQFFRDKGADSVVSVCECEHSPLLSNTLPADLNMAGFIRSEHNVRRQDLETCYRLNGAIYISKVSTFLQIQTFYGSNSYAYIMEQNESIDIDSELDFRIAELLLRSQPQD